MYKYALDRADSVLGQGDGVGDQEDCCKTPVSTLPLLFPSLPNLTCTEQLRHPFLCLSLENSLLVLALFHSPPPAPCFHHLLLITKS